MAHGGCERIHSQVKKIYESALGRTRYGKKSASRCRSVMVVQDVIGLRSVPSGADADELLLTRRERHERAWNNVENNSQARKRRGLGQ